MDTFHKLFGIFIKLNLKLTDLDDFYFFLINLVLKDV
jgi:hypothetical protein